MEEKAREFLDLLDNDDEFSEAQCNEFQKKFDDYLESLTEQEQEYFVSNYGRRIIGLLFCKRYKIKTIKNKKTLEFINRINHPEGLTAEQLIQLSDELDDYLSTLPEKEQDEFAQRNYAESFEMIITATLYDLQQYRLYTEHKIERHYSHDKKYIKIQNSKTLELIDRIAHVGNISYEQVLELKNETDKYLQLLSKEERDEFIETGFTTALSILCNDIIFGTPLSKKLTCSKANSRRYHRN